MSEKKDRIEEQIARIIASTHSLFNERYGAATADEFYAEAKEILSIKELAVVKRDAELPDIEDYCQCIQGVSDYSGRMEAYRLSQQDMLDAGYVQEVCE